MKKVIAILAAVCVSAACRAGSAPDADAFAAAFYSAVSSGVPADENLAVSPAGAFRVLSVLAAAARGDTAVEIMTALKFPSGTTTDGFIEAVSRLDAAISAAGEAGGAQFISTGSMWHRDDVNIKPEFAGLAERELGYSVRPAKMNAESAAEINGFVKKETQGEIDEIIGPGDLTADTMTVIVNTLLMKAKWEKPFKKSSTADSTFYTPNGPVTNKFMSCTEMFPVAHGSGFTAVSMPYRNGTAEFLLIVPDKDVKLSDLEQKVSETMFGLAFTNKTISLTIPKMSLKWRDNITQAICRLGIKKAFTGGADFSSMSDIPLSVDTAVQSVRVKVDEEGTVAAAATAVTMIRMMLSPPPEETIVADRPFLFRIRLSKTGETLFMGRVCTPGAEE